MTRKRKHPKSKRPTAKVTAPMQELIDLLGAGEALPDDNATRTRLYALRRRGLVTVERTDDGDVWTLGKPS